VEVGRHIRASTMSMALLATPSLGILISALTLGEAVGASLVAGVVLIGSGIRLATRASDQCPSAACSQVINPVGHRDAWRALIQMKQKPSSIARKEASSCRD
jgi:predicted benzoate:H+ symporter BenE